MYRFEIVQEEDGWHYKAYGPIDYTSRAFVRRQDAYGRACELGYIPISSNDDQKRP